MGELWRAKVSARFCCIEKVTKPTKGVIKSVAETVGKCYSLKKKMIPRHRRRRRRTTDWASGFGDSESLKYITVLCCITGDSSMGIRSRLYGKCTHRSLWSSLERLWLQRGEWSGFWERDLCGSRIFRVKGQGGACAMGRIQGGGTGQGMEYDTGELKK